MSHTMNESVFLHEISNPLTIAIGMLEGAAHLSQSGRLAEAEEKTQRSLEHLQKVIDLVNLRRRLISSDELQ